MAQVGSVNCHTDADVCHRLQPQNAILFYPVEHFPLNDSYSITSLSLKEIVAQVLALSPDLLLITKDHLNVREFNYLRD